MPIPAVAGTVWQVLVQGSIEEQQCENVLFFRSVNGDTDVLLHLIADLVECFLTGLVPNLSTTYTFERIVARQIAPAMGAEVIFTPEAGDPVQGASAGDAEPSFVSALISLRTTRAGRSGRGRMFIAGVAEGETTASLINSEGALWAALLAFCLCMLGKFVVGDPPAANSWEWGVFSRKIGGFKEPFNAVGFAPITSATPSRELATTRSRKIGRGR
jgi:hypothetical protein